MKEALRFLADDRGQDLVEYSLLLAFIMFTVLGLIRGFNTSISGVESTTNSNLSAAASIAVNGH